jgi:hypothetical protein
MVKIEINGERWYTPQQMLLLLGVGHHVYLARYVKSGKIEKKKVDHMTFYRFSEDYIDDHVLDKCQRKDWNTLKV